MIFELREIEQTPAVNSLIYESSMPSTSDKAKSLLRSHTIPETPLLVLCDHQTAGRGQPGKTWQSDHDSLTFTWCISVDSIPPQNHHLLSLLAGISICKALDTIGIPNSKLKWPNDVLLDRKKACGILVEKVAATCGSFFLIGIGVNVNQEAMSLPPSRESNRSFTPVSLRQHCGREIDKQRLLLEIVGRLSRSSIDTESTQSESHRYEFLDEQIQFMLPTQEVIAGTFCGINAIGQIEINVDGAVQSFSSGHILSDD